jgi:hypothetical protein
MNGYSVDRHSYSAFCGVASSGETNAWSLSVIPLRGVRTRGITRRRGLGVIWPSGNGAALVRELVPESAGERQKAARSPDSLWAAAPCQGRCPVRARVPEAGWFRRDEAARR